MAMTSLPHGFRLIEELYRGRFVVSRCERLSDKQQVVVKAVDSVLPGTAARLRYEHRLLTTLGPQVHVPMLLEFIDQDNCALVFADCGARDLGSYLRREALPFAEILSIVSQVADALIVVHAAHIIHRDINPNNIIFNRDTGEAQLIDFGIATQLDRQSQAGRPLEKIEGTLAYLSPEQTGRTSIEVDYRTDFYALGATLYHLLTGRPPFVETDARNLLTAVLSGVPTAASTLQPSVPAVLSDIVGKLLHKAPEDRYQSAYGILRDLQRCAELLTPDGNITAFRLAEFDNRERLELRQRLYGREAEVLALQDVYQRAQMGTRQLALLHGVSGAGKTSLVGMLKPALAQHSALYLSGKFDVLRQHIPFSAFSQAIHDLTRQIFANNPDVVAAWRQRISHAVGRLGQALVDIAPTLELLLGPQEPLAVVPPEQTQNRLLRVLSQFVQTLCVNQPLVLFLDDLQWADAGTLTLLGEILCAPDACGGLLVIGSYRSNEIDAGHALTLFLRGLARDFSAVTSIELSALTVDAVRALVADALHTQDSAALADLVFQRTGGNPLFAAELLRHLNAQKLVTYDLHRAQWTWDLRRIAAQQVSDNIVGLLTAKVADLPQASRLLLGRAACMGDRIAVQQVAAAQDTLAQPVAEALWPAAQAGLLLALDDGYESGNGLPMHYRFAHDRVHQACYESLSPEERQLEHLNTGRRLHQANRTKPVGDWLFDVIGHLNRGSDLMDDPTEIQALVEMNFAAGLEARRATAYTQAAAYFTQALALVPRAKAGADLINQIEVQWADTEYLNGDFAGAQVRYERLLRDATDSVARASVLVRQADVAVAVNRRDEACAILRQAAGLLGLPIAQQPSNAQLGLALMRVYSKLRTLDLTRLATLPPMQKEADMVLADVLHNMHDHAFFSGQHELSAVAGLHLMLLTLKRGSTKRTSSAVAATIMIVTAALKDIAMANRLEDAFRSISEKVVIEADSAYVAVACMVMHLRIKPQRLIVEARVLADAAWQNGYHFYASLLESYIRSLLLYSDLDAAAPVGDRSLHAAVRRNDQIAAAMHRCSRQQIRCMMGETIAPNSFSDAEYDEAAEVLRMDSDETLRVSRAGYLVSKMTATLVHGDHACANACANRLLETNSLRYMGGETCYAAALAAFGGALTQTQAAFSQGRTRVEYPRAMRAWVRIARWFGRHGPQIYRGLPMLLDAELAALRGDASRAMGLYERALPLLEESGWRCYLAIAYECAGRFYERLGSKRVAAVHLQAARDTYRAWGAKRKLAMLQQEFPHYLNIAMPVTATATEGSATHDAEEGTTTASLALAAIEAVAAALDVEALYTALAHGLFATAGATHVIVARPQDSGWHALACETIGRPQSSELASEPMPQRLLRHCFNTRTPVGLDSGDKNPLWHDPYFTKRDVKSVLCLPIAPASKPPRVAYIENSWVRGGLTHAKTQRVLQLICMQAVSALENISMRNDVERTAQERVTAIQATQAQRSHSDNVLAEERLAGGFAHEIRNALMPARSLAEHVLDSTAAPAGGPADPAAQALLQVVELTDPHLPESIRAHVRQVIQPIVSYLDASAEALVGIEQSTSRAMRIVSLIMDYARLGEEQPGRDTVAVDNVLQRLLGEMLVDLQREHIDLDITLAPDAAVVGKEEHLYAIISNLLLNARQALTSVGDLRKRQLRVHLTQQSANHVRLTIGDNGIGMSDEVQAKLGAPFFTTKGSLGTGLGMGTVKKLVALYHGNIEVSSKTNEGSVFTIDI